MLKSNHADLQVLAESCNEKGTVWVRNHKDRLKDRRRFSVSQRKARSSKSVSEISLPFPYLSETYLGQWASVEIKVQATGDTAEKSQAAADGSRKGRTAVLRGTDKAGGEHGPCWGSHCRHQPCRPPRVRNHSRDQNPQWQISPLTVRANALVHL